MLTTYARKCALLDYAALPVKYVFCDPLSTQPSKPDLWRCNRKHDICYLYTVMMMTD